MRKERKGNARVHDNSAISESIGGAVDKDRTGIGFSSEIMSKRKEGGNRESGLGWEDEGHSKG